MLLLPMSDAQLQPKSEQELRDWAENLAAAVRQVLAKHPEADPENVRHALILLQEPPIERLRRSLTRGRFSAQRK